MNGSGRWMWCGVVVLLGLGCGPDSQAEFSADDEGLELSVGELNASLVLQFVNSAEATLDVLTADVRLDVRAARGIVAGKPFATLAALDAVAYVGPSALTKLDAFATSRLGSGGVTVEGVSFTAAEARDAISVANDARLAEVGLTSTALNGLVANRPYTTLVAVGAVSGVGPAALTRLRDYARLHASPGPVVGGCTGQGGTFDGVVFSRDEDCHAVDFLNQARFSEMSAISDAARLIAYETGPDGVFGFRRSAWTSVREFSDRPGVGVTAVTGVKTGAATWARNGLSYDTVAATWTNRVALTNQPLYLDKVYVVKVNPNMGEGGYDWQCAELRDAPTAPNYILGCYPTVVCEGGDCWPGKVGTFVRVHGSFRKSALAGSGGYRISLSGGVGAANPLVP